MSDLHKRIDHEIDKRVDEILQIKRLGRKALELDALGEWTMDQEIEADRLHAALAGYGIDWFPG